MKVLYCCCNWLAKGLDDALGRNFETNGANRRGGLALQLIWSIP